MILAIDPGLSGGIAWCDREGITHAKKMPSVEPDITALLRSIILLEQVKEAFVENPPLFTGRKVTAQSLCKLHRNLGYILGALDTLFVRTVLVKPQDWQAHFRLGRKKDHGPKWKSVLATEARRRFPDLDVTLATADSLLLLDYGKTVKNNQPHA